MSRPRLLSTLLFALAVVGCTSPPGPSAFAQQTPGIQVGTATGGADTAAAPDGPSSVATERGAAQTASDSAPVPAIPTLAPVPPEPTAAPAIDPAAQSLATTDPSAGASAVPD